MTVFMDSLTLQVESGPYLRFGDRTSARWYQGKEPDCGYQEDQAQGAFASFCLTSAHDEAKIRDSTLRSK